MLAEYKLVQSLDDVLFIFGVVLVQSLDQL